MATVAGAPGPPRVAPLAAPDRDNFGPKDSVPEPFRGRTLDIHSAAVDVVRTTGAECAEVGRILARKLNRTPGPLTVFSPHDGVSMNAMPGGPIHDPAADATLIRELKAGPWPEVEVVAMAADSNAGGRAPNGEQTLARCRRTVGGGGIIWAGIGRDRTAKTAAPVRSPSP